MLVETRDGQRETKVKSAKVVVDKGTFRRPRRQQPRQTQGQNEGQAFFFLPDSRTHLRSVLKGDMEYGLAIDNMPVVNLMRNRVFQKRGCWGAAGGWCEKKKGI